MVEILSPAGSIESFYSAINGGANAVYLGLDDFSARKNAQNFTKENLPFFVNYAHLFGVKVYLALNTLIKDTELEKFFDFASFANEIGVDALIIQDMALGKILKNAFPDLELHLSTQAGVNNEYGATLAKEFGFSRVVLARETAFEEIKKIAKIIPTEVFVQGALCSSFSGQCYMSSFAGNLSGNRGLCKQPCRKKYKLVSPSLKTEGYLISLADLSLQNDIFKYIDAGVVSFKIEGRMRSSAYVFSATNYYRGLLDGKNPSISPLTRTFNRGNFTKGLAFSQDENFISSKVQSHLGEEVALISKVQNGKIQTIPQIEKTVGNGYKIIRGGFEVGSCVVDKNSNLTYFGDAKIGDKIFITKDQNLENKIKNFTRLLKVEVFGEFLKGCYPKVTAKLNGVLAQVIGETVLEKAKNQPLSSIEIETALSKADTLPFEISASVKTDGVFMPKSMLNALRRKLFEKLVLSFNPHKNRRFIEFEIPTLEKTLAENSLAIIDDDFSFASDFSFDYAIFAPQNYLEKECFETFFNNLKNHKALRFLYLPPMLNSEDNELIAPLLDKFDGIFVDGLYGIEYAKKFNKKLFLGSQANVYNNLDLKFLSPLCDEICLSKEATLSFAKNNESAFYFSLGSIKVMELNYCVFNKELCPCNNDISYLIDEDRKFILRKVKLSSCRFEVYNLSNLVTKGSKKNLISLLTYDFAKKKEILQNLGNFDKLKQILSPHTLGHSEKPLI